MYKGSPHFSCSLTSQANIWLLITSCLFNGDRFISAISGEDHGINLIPDQKNGLGQLDSLRELNKLLVRRLNRAGGIKWCPEVEEDHGACAGWGKPRNLADREESEPLTSMARDRSWRPAREMNCSPEPSGITPTKPLLGLRFLSNHYPCYDCNTALHWLTCHLHVFWSQFWVMLCSLQSNQLDINLFYKNKQYSSFT